MKKLYAVLAIGIMLMAFTTTLASANMIDDIKAFLGIGIKPNPEPLPVEKIPSCTAETGIHNCVYRKLCSYEVQGNEAVETKTTEVRTAITERKTIYKNITTYENQSVMLKGKIQYKMTPVVTTQATIIQIPVQDTITKYRLSQTFPFIESYEVKVIRTNIQTQEKTSIKAGYTLNETDGKFYHWGQC